MKKNIQICLGSLFLVLGSIFTACGPDARLDMVGMFAGTSPTINDRFEISQAYNQQMGFHFADDGILDVSRKGIQIIDKTKLRSIAY